MIRRVMSGLILSSVMLVSSGCIGIYNNSELFLNPVEKGMSEEEILQKYGNPAYSGFAEDKKVYIYEVRNNRYIVAFGQYEGYDLVITCEAGEVIQVDKVQRPESFVLFQPVPWAETD